MNTDAIIKEHADRAVDLLMEEFSCGKVTAYAVFHDHFVRAATPTLRDQFAMACMSSMDKMGNAEHVAKRAYEIADAMIAVRVR